MERLRKLLTVMLALLVGFWFVPGVGSTYNLMAVASEAQATVPMLPMGDELGDEELAAVEGELVVELLGIYLAAKATLVLAKGAAAAAYAAYKKAGLLTRGALWVAYRIAKGAERGAQSTLRQARRAYHTAMRAADALARWGSTSRTGASVEGGVLGGVAEGINQISTRRFSARNFGRSVVIGAGVGAGWWQWRHR